MKNIAASIKDRLQNLARTEGIHFNDVLEQFALARFFARLSAGDHAEKFILKGAQLFTLWAGSSHRPTRDADFLSFGSPDPTALAATFNEIASTPTTPLDGLDWELVKAAPIREDNLDGGVRLKLIASLGKVRIPVQIDVGFGDSITPAAQLAEWKSPLDFPPARLLAYCPETVIAEKLHAAVVLDTGNSRMKDFFDLLWLSRNREFDGARLREAIQATFARRGTPMPTGPPVAFTAQFHSRADKRSQWSAFLRKGRLESVELPGTIESIAHFLNLVIVGETDGATWNPATGWTQG